MAKNQSRSMAEDFDQGSLDGSYKRIIRNQEGVIADPNRGVRKQMSWRFGFEQEVVGHRPDDDRPVVLRP